MKYRAFGRHSNQVSEIGYGSWGIGGGPAWSGTEDPLSQKCLLRAFELGVNFFDTALVYGNGHSESLLGEFAQKVGRHHILIATKIPPKNMEWPARPEVTLSDTFDKNHIRLCTEKSLKHLQSDYIDVQQLHVWQDSWLSQDEWKEELTKLKEEGKIRFVGVSINSHNPESAIQLVQSRIIDSIQLIYNIFDPRARDILFQHCQENGIAVIARVPLDEGGLSGKITKDTTFPEGDFRSLYFKDHRTTEVEERVHRLRNVMRGRVHSVPELALRFCLSHPQVTTVIPGMRKIEHVEVNVSASAAGPLSDDLLQELKDHAWIRNFYPSRQDIQRTLSVT